MAKKQSFIAITADCANLRYFRRPGLVLLDCQRKVIPISLIQRDHKGKGCLNYKTWLKIPGVILTKLIL
jgi:hypothetical protein